jgi:hypothetical protein
VAAPSAASRSPEADGHGWQAPGALPGGRALFFFDEALTVDAVAGEGQRFEALVGDLPASLAVAEVASVDLLQGGDDFLQDPAVAIAQLEEELAVVGRGGLIAEVLREIVLGLLPYSTFFPTSSTSWRCFSSSFFLNWASRSFFIAVSSATRPVRGRN